MTEEYKSFHFPGVVSPATSSSAERSEERLATSLFLREDLVKDCKKPEDFAELERNQDTAFVEKPKVCLRA